MIPRPGCRSVGDCATGGVPKTLRVCGLGEEGFRRVQRILAQGFVPSRVRSWLRDGAAVVGAPVQDHLGGHPEEGEGDLRAIHHHVGEHVAFLALGAALEEGGEEAGLDVRLLPRLSVRPGSGNVVGPASPLFRFFRAAGSRPCRVAVSSASVSRNARTAPRRRC